MAAKELLASWQASAACSAFFTSALYQAICISTACTGVELYAIMIVVTACCPSSTEPLGAARLLREQISRCSLFTSAVRAP